MATIGGKWYASSREGDDAGDVRYVLAGQPAGEKYIVAKVWANDDGDFESTARLVAAAPELLNAVRISISYLNGVPECWCEEGYECDNCVRVAALNKAEGRSK